MHRTNSFFYLYRPLDELVKVTQCLNSIGSSKGLPYLLDYTRKTYKIRMRLVIIYFNYLFQDL